MKPFDYAKKQILEFVADDVLDFPFAYGFAAEALKGEELPAPEEILDLVLEVLLALLKSDRIVVGDLVGAVENFVPWGGTPAEVIRKLKIEVLETGIENIGDDHFVCWILDKKRLVNQLGH